MELKNLKKTVFLLSAICFLFCSCGGQKSTPVVPSSRTLEPTLNATNTLTSTIITTPTRYESVNFSGKPTYTPFPPYSLKNVIFLYHIYGGHADDEFLFPGGIPTTILVLYDDGQMIINGPGIIYNQVFLSSSEISYFLSYIETLGFLSIESNQKHDLTDALYHFDGDYIEYADGEKVCISMDADKSRTLCARDLYLPDLIPEMKNLLKYLDDYQPQGMTEYIPDRVILTIDRSDPSYDLPPAIPWDKQLPSLEKVSGRSYSDIYNEVIFIDGDLAKDLYHYFNGEYMKVVLEDDKEYIVYLHVVLPHEEVINPPR